MVPSFPFPFPHPLLPPPFPLPLPHPPFAVLSLALALLRLQLWMRCGALPSYLSSASAIINDGRVHSLFPCPTGCPGPGPFVEVEVAVPVAPGSVAHPPRRGEACSSLFFVQCPWLRWRPCRLGPSFLGTPKSSRRVTTPRPSADARTTQ